MRKTILMAFAALAFAAGNAYAQSMTGTIAPKPGYTCDFENAEKADFNEKEIVINGKRWLFRNARITDSAIHGIPQGNRAAELLAGSVDGKQACIELLDTVHGAGISFCFSHYRTQQRGMVHRRDRRRRKYMGHNAADIRHE